MGKKKDAAAKASAKSKKTKIPKTIAGVTIPKTLRDSGKAAVKLAQNPVARELLTAGLAAAATAIAANGRARKAATDAGRAAADATGEAASTAGDSAARIGAALAGVAGVAAQRFLGLGEDQVAKPAPAATETEASAEPDAPVDAAPVDAAPVRAAQPRKAATKSAAATEFPLPPNGRA